MSSSPSTPSQFITQDLTVRPLLAGDVEAATAIIAAAFREADGSLPERYSPPVIADRLAASVAAQRPSRSRFIVVEHLGKLAALGGYSKEAWSPCAWSLYMAAVRPDLQGHGLGRVLIQQRLKAIQQATIGIGMVLVSSRRPSSFESLGFQTLRKMPHGPTLMAWEFLGKTPA
jgi:GNAT superfamily N-acetyltransferase